MNRLASSVFSARKVLSPLDSRQLPGSSSDNTKMTTLPNGVRIVSEMGPKTGPNPEATIGIYVDCGTIYETPMTFGVSQLLECMAFKLTTNPNQLCMAHELATSGARVKADASRETMGYVIEGLKTNVRLMVQLLVDFVRNPAFLDCQVQKNLVKLKSLISEASNDPERLLMDALHSTGYAGALANPLSPPKSALYRLNNKILKDFVAENYTAPRIVLSAVGVDHEYLLSIAEPLLSDLPSVPRPEMPQSVYVGGDYRCQAGFGITHFALAFEAPGGRFKHKEALILSLLRILVGGGQSDFTCRGDERCTRLCSRVHGYPQIQACHALISFNHNTALFGIRATTRSGFASKAVEIAAEELIAVVTPGTVKQEKLEHAKESFKSGLMMSMESSVKLCGVIGGEVLTFGERIPVEHDLKVIDEVTTDDIVSVGRKLMSSPLTMACYGDVRKVPSYDQVKRMFSSI